MTIMRRYLWIPGVVFVADQLTKYLATAYLARTGEVRLGPFLNLVLVHNTGAAFGFLSNAGGWQNAFFIGITLLASGFILWMISRLKQGEMLLAVALFLILGGALGNLVDRLVHGYVIDFIDVHYHHWHWPAFNVADSAITIGAIILILDVLQPESHKTH